MGLAFKRETLLSAKHKSLLLDFCVNLKKNQGPYVVHMPIV